MYASWWEEITAGHPNWCSIFCCGFFIILCICIYHWACKAQHRVSAYSCETPLCSPPRATSMSDLPAMFRALPPGNLPHGHLQSLFSLVGRQNSFLCFRGRKRDMFRFPYLHCCSPPISIHFMDSGGHLKGAHGDICLLIPVTFHTWKEVRMGIDMSYFKAPLKFP